MTLCLFISTRTLIILTQPYLLCFALWMPARSKPTEELDAYKIKTSGGTEIYQSVTTMNYQSATTTTTNLSSLILRFRSLSSLSFLTSNVSISRLDFSLLSRQMSLISSSLNSISHVYIELGNNFYYTNFSGDAQSYCGGSLIPKNNLIRGPGAVTRRWMEV